MHISCFNSIKKFFPKQTWIEDRQGILASGTLYSDNTFSRIHEMVNIENFFSYILYLRTQKAILFPLSNFIYKQCHKIISEGFQNFLPLVLIGDGSFDSEGFNTKYGTYSLTNAHNKIMKKLIATSCRLQ